MFLKVVFFSGAAYAQDVTLLDRSHYSDVLGEIRNYRVFLPPGYDTSEERYPVIYYYHGWSQRYFAPLHYDADEDFRKDGGEIADFVADHKVIVVKADGYNRRPDEPYYVRPYNIGPVETYRQFPLYFPALVDHVDGNFRTVADREHRAIAGLSMGGFMAFWIGGKYPHLVSAVGNFCGSAEFFVGPKVFPVEYRNREMYSNYGGVNVRLHYGDKDFIRGYHNDMNKIWTQVMDNYEYKVYDAAHTTAGLKDMFRFLLKTFENPLKKPPKWSHIDVYPAFSVWNYRVESNRDIPGFTILEDVNKRGFRSSVRTFLPDGELMPSVSLTVTTPPVYEKNQLFKIRDVDPVSGETSVNFLKSDKDGRLRIGLNGSLHEIGIDKAEGSPNIVVASYQVENKNWAVHGQEIDLSIKLLNKGSEIARDVTASLKATRKSAVVLQPESKFGKVGVGKIKTPDKVVTFLVKDKEVEIERFHITIRDANGNKWTDVIDIPVKADGPEIDFIIADGKEFSVASAGDDTVSVFLGKGNGDGKANPGESIVILANEKGRYYRTFLHSGDPYVNPGGIHIRKSDSWQSYDHVGASAKYSIPVLASDSPENHRVTFFAEYWLPDYPFHRIKRGVAGITVSGTDQVPPVLEWVRMRGDNTIQVKLYDGGKIASVKAQLHVLDSPEKSFEITLNNKGEAGDLVCGDLVFSAKIQPMGLGLYQVVIQAEDMYGNSLEEAWPDSVVVY